MIGPPLGDRQLDGRAGSAETQHGACGSQLGWMSALVVLEVEACTFALRLSHRTEAQQGFVWTLLS